MNKFDFLYDKSIICLNCEHTFVTKKVRQGTQAVASRDADFCTYYKEQAGNPVLYTVCVCPRCGFSFTEQFSSPLSAQARKHVQVKITAKWTAKEFGSVRSLRTAIAAYKLAIYASQLTDQPYSVKAGLCLRLGWLYRYLKDNAEELRFLRLAVEQYEQSYVHSDYRVGDKEMSEVRLLYLIGELNRRIGEFDQAIRYFSKAISLKGQTIETGIIQMAHEQWSLARETYAQQQKQRVGS
ncbi:MAG: DUF2225 domain-containing protein [Brevibacillus sp.]|nr:DUF2225 domain-containing protein [Brevibacillus sp.]